MYYIDMELEIKIPDNLREITLGQYQKYLKIQESNEDNLFVAQKMIEIFCNVDLKYVMKMRWVDVEEVTNTLTTMFDQEPNFTKQFTLKGKQYGFIPNLDDISFGEFVDLDGALGDWSLMHHAMCILYRPVDISVRGRYNIESYTGELNDTMKDMPLDVALGSVFFLLNLGKELSQVMMDYLHRGVLDQDSLVKQHSMKNGNGIAVFGTQLKEILQSLKISPNLDYTKS